MSSQSELHSDKTVSVAHLNHLSQQVHSSNENESREALKELAQMRSNDAARALIDAYRNCHWRDTRIHILRSLGRNASQRAVEFLLRIASLHFPANSHEGKDIGLCQEALLSLGNTRDPIAASYLLNRLNSCPDYLKTCIVDSVSRIPDLRAAPMLNRLLNSKETAEQPQLLRNVVVALSEIKDTSALQTVLEMLKSRMNSASHLPDTTSLTLLTAIARLSRRVADLEQFEEFFQGELLYRQLYQQCHTQINIRHQWTLEDYLGKIFSADKFHHSLPLELNSFSADDLSECLSLFNSDEQHFYGLCTIIGASLHAPALLDKFIQIKFLSNAQAQALLENLGLQSCAAARKIVAEVGENQLKPLWQSSEFQPLISTWLKTLLCIDESPLNTFYTLLDSQTFKTAHDRQKIEVINAFVNCILVYQTETTWPKKSLQLITDLVSKENSNVVVGRWLRALGEINLGDLKWNTELRERVGKSEELHASLLLMLENEDVHQHNEVLRVIAQTLPKKTESIAAFLRACASLKSPEKDLPSDEQIKTALNSERSDEQIAALSFLGRHPRLSCLDSVISFSRPEIQHSGLSVHAIVAARSYQNIKTLPSLEKCLLSPSRVVSGRALDALLHLQDPKANAVVVQFLVNHLNNHNVCDKVLRSLKAGQQGQPELATLLEDATHHVGETSLKDDLLELASRLRFGQAEAAVAEPSGGAIKDIDKQLESKIVGYAKLSDSVKASLRSAELPLHEPELFEATVDKSASVVQYCKALDLTLEKDFGQAVLFPKMEQQLHIFQNILHQAELDNETTGINRVLRHFRAEHVFDAGTLPLSKMQMVARSILNGRILRERTQVIDGLKAWAVLLVMFSGHERLWGAQLIKGDPDLFHTLAHKLVLLQDLRNPAAHRQTMLALAPLSEIRKEVFQTFALIKKAFG